MAVSVAICLRMFFSNIDIADIEKSHLDALKTYLGVNYCENQAARALETR